MTAERGPGNIEMSTQAKGVGRVNYLLRTVVLAALVGLGWVGYNTAGNLLDGHRAEVAERDSLIKDLNGKVQEQDEHIGGLKQDVAQRDRRIVKLVVDVEERDAQIEELDTALHLLKIDHRIARLTVLEQRQLPGGQYETRVRFEELDPEGNLLGESVEYTLPGKVAYIESLVIKFSDDYVERGDVWRGSSICFFRRLFSETQSPEQGFPLDRVGERPQPYSDDQAPELVSRLWLRFWDYANDPEQAAAIGVRAIHGEAPFVELRPGSSYLIELRSSGGLSLRRE